MGGVSHPSPALCTHEGYAGLGTLKEPEPALRTPRNASPSTGGTVDTPAVGGGGVGSAKPL